MKNNHLKKLILMDILLKLYNLLHKIILKMIIQISKIMKKKLKMKIIIIKLIIVKLIQDIHKMELNM